MKSGTDLFEAARARIRQVSPREVKDMQERGEQVVLLDVRDQNEVNLGIIPGALHVSRGTLESKVEAAIPDRAANVVIYCASGNRSALAVLTMEEMGYTTVASMSGGFRDWATEIGEID